MRAETADCGFLDRDGDFMGSEQFADQLLIERLGEAQVGDGCAESLGFEPFCGLLGFFKPGTERQDGDLGSLLNDPPLADFQPFQCFRNRYAGAIAARITEGDRTAVV